MSANAFWEVLYNDSLRTAEVYGPSYNDERLIGQVEALKQQGFEAHCTTPPYGAYANRQMLVTELQDRGYKCT